MGSNRSVAGPSSLSEGDMEGNDDIYIQGAPIPPQILTEILLRIDSPRDIGYVCPLVCRRWCNVLCAPGFWVSYMEYRSVVLPPTSIRSEPSLNIKKVCLKRGFGQNLIDNPSGEKSFEGWTICENGGNRFLIERPPVGCASCLECDIRVAFATSFGWCRKYYIVDLWKKGIEAFLDEYCPPVTVSEYYNCRYDCASTYYLNVELIPDGQIDTSRVTTDDMPEVIPLIRRLRRQGPQVRARRPQPMGERTTSSSITRTRAMEQWTGAEWQKIEHTFTDYPQGIRYVVFEHGGKDNQFWAGHYGAKMAKASVVVNFGNGERRQSST